MGGIALPIETEAKYTLVEIDDSGSSRIAELQIEAVTDGATEVPGGMLSVDMTTEGTGSGWTRPLGDRIAVPCNSTAAGPTAAEHMRVPDRLPRNPRATGA
jgi:hypothetical protein